MRKTKTLLILLLFALMTQGPLQSVRADFVMTISMDGPIGPVAQGDLASFDFNISFSSDVPAEYVNSISFGFSNGTTSPALVSDFSAISSVDQFWVGGFDSGTGVGSFTADLGNEIFSSNSPKTIGRITVDTTNLSPGTYSLFVQSTDWLVLGSADGENVLFNGTSVSGGGNSIEFPPVVAFTIHAVPEPSSMALVLVTCCLGTMTRFRKQ